MSEKMIDKNYKDYKSEVDEPSYGVPQIDKDSDLRRKNLEKYLEMSQDYLEARIKQSNHQTSSSPVLPIHQENWARKVRLFDFLIGAQYREAIVGDLAERMNILENNGYSKLKIWNELTVELFGLVSSTIMFRIRDFFISGEEVER